MPLPKKPAQQERQRLKKLHRNRQTSRSLTRRSLTLSNNQIKVMQKYIELSELLSKVGLTTFDVLHIFYTLPMEWQEYYLAFPEETDKYIMDKLGDPSLLTGLKRKKAKKTKKKSKGKKDVK